MTVGLVPDAETNHVVFADLLELRYPALFKNLVGTLQRFGVGVSTVKGTRDIWCRDYLPIQIGKGRFVQFIYAPDYLRDHPETITSPTVVETLPFVEQCQLSDIVLDGGNVIRHRGHAIMTEKIYSENPRVPRSQLQRRLMEILEIERLTIIPREPGDPLGHADGTLQFLDAKTVVVGDYRGVDPGYDRKLTSVLEQAGLEIVRVPYAPDFRVKGSEIPPATGVYANFLRTHTVTLLPTYGIPADDRAIDALSATMSNVVPIRCDDVAQEGGALNCISWNVAV